MTISEQRGGTAHERQSTIFPKRYCEDSAPAGFAKYSDDHDRHGRFDHGVGDGEAALAGFRLFDALIQLDGYIEASEYQRGDENISGKFVYKGYFVQFWSAGQGIILYSFRKVLPVHRETYEELHKIDKPDGKVRGEIDPPKKTSEKLATAMALAGGFCASAILTAALIQRGGKFMKVLRPDTLIPV